MRHVDDRTDYTLQMLVLERRDDRCNMARYYVLSVEPTLFGDVALVRQWGRIGSPGRLRLDLHADDGAAGEALETWLARKIRRGYRRIPANPAAVISRSTSWPVSEAPLANPVRHRTRAGSRPWRRSR